MSFLPVLHTPAEDRAFFRTRVFPACEIWITDENGVAGFIAFRDGWIEHLYIHPAHQRRGLGRALLAQAKKCFPELQLWAFQKNHNAIDFYEANGFRLVRRTDGDENLTRFIYGIAHDHPAPLESLRHTRQRAGGGYHGAV